MNEKEYVEALKPLLEKLEEFRGSAKWNTGQVINALAFIIHNYLAEHTAIHSPGCVACWMLVENIGATVEMARRNLSMRDGKGSAG